jgi:S-adenosylmethionine:tRNA ribosyltransferase-isomerase
MENDLNLSAYHYHLPEELIAQHPADRRDESRLMVLQGKSGKQQHRRFHELIDLINPGDMLVVNNTRVFPARLYGIKETGGKVEVFLLEYPQLRKKDGQLATATALVKASKRPKPGTEIHISNRLFCRVKELLDEGKLRLELDFDKETGLAGCLSEAGQIPLPPYIKRDAGSTSEDRERYQTVYAATSGAVAAPTAGLHFTDEMLHKLKVKGAQIAEVTLHVGYGTFAPVREEDITRHQIHREFISLPEETVARVTRTKERGGKIWAVGTTTVRALEYAALRSGKLRATDGWCDLYIYPGFQFRVIDNLITNFHLPDSSLMFLVSALCGRQNLLECYSQAVKRGYRFFSYGDAMAIICSRD